MNPSLEQQLEKKDCHDCNAKPGDLHDGGCDTERCPECGRQIIGCNCFTEETWPEDSRRLPWTGIWPGVVECLEFGWYTKWVEHKGPGPLGGWLRCSQDDPEARADLNRLYCGEAEWDGTLKRWVLRK